MPFDIGSLLSRVLAVPGAADALRTFAEQTLAGRRDFKRLHWGDEPTGLAQSPAPKRFKRLVALGELSRIGYLTSKDGEVAEWIHCFGEEDRPGQFSGPRPKLLVGFSGDDSTDLVIVRGQSDYYVDDHGIIG